MIPINDEIRAAAKWWADKMRTNAAPEVNNGARTAHDMFGEAFIGFAQKSRPPADPTTVDIFETALVAAIAAEIDTWDVDNPILGGYSRVVDVDYKPCNTLEKAAEIAGIKSLWAYLPIKTIMWINPGRVVVRQGYHARREAIFGEPLSEEEV